jgi:hypothetical protein
MINKRTDPSGRSDVYLMLLKIQNNHLVYFKRIQMELIDCVNIHEDLTISLKPHCNLPESLIVELKNTFTVLDNLPSE